MSYSKQPRPKQSGPAPSSSSSTDQSQQSGPDNSYVAALIETAIVQANAETSYLSLAADAGFDPEQFLFAEDNDQEIGPLPELREKHSDKTYGEFSGGTAFLQGGTDAHQVDPNDVAQGSLGDCYLMAGMIAVARANPQAIEDLITDHGDGTFTVTLYLRQNYYSSPVATPVTIDSRLPEKYPGTPLYAKTGDSDGVSTELWPALIEKAVAQQKGSYELISGGNIGKGGFTFAGATELLTGKKEGYLRTSSMDGDDALLHMAIALEERKPCTCDSKNMADDESMASDAKQFNVYGNHAYIPESVDLDGRTVTLTNPWGSHHVAALPVADFLRFYRSIRIGE